MGVCLSTGMGDISVDDRRRHLQVEKQLKEVRLSVLAVASSDTFLSGQGQAGYSGQGESVCSRPSPPRTTHIHQVLLLGSGDSGKSTVLKVGIRFSCLGFSPSYSYPYQQMRLIHKVPFLPQEIEYYRLLVFSNLITGMIYLLDAMEEMNLDVAEQNLHHIDSIRNAHDLEERQPFPSELHEPLSSLWSDENVQLAYHRGNEAALPEKCVLDFLPFRGHDMLPRPQFSIFLPVARSPFRAFLSSL